MRLKFEKWGKIIKLITWKLIVLELQGPSNLRGFNM